MAFYRLFQEVVLPAERLLSLTQHAQLWVCLISSLLGEEVGGCLSSSGIFCLSLLFSVGLVKFHELGEIELWLLEDFNLLDEDVLERENLGALFGDFLANVFREAERIY